MKITVIYEVESKAQFDSIKELIPNLSALVGTTEKSIQNTPKKLTFKNGDRVKWRNNSQHEYQFGRVVAVVPKNHTPRSTQLKTTVVRKQFSTTDELKLPYQMSYTPSGCPRDHTSYLILNDRNGKLYWPKVYNLEHIT